MNLLSLLFPKMFFSIDPITLSALIGGGASIASAFSGRKKKKNQVFRPEPFTGQEPFSAQDIGLPAGDLAEVSKQFRNQILERSRGEGLVGFGPEFLDISKRRISGDIGEARKEALQRASAQASAQGLRGGIPLEISRQTEEDFGDSLADAIAEIELQNLAAKREDINQATYAQPELVESGAGIQAQRGAFDLQRYLAEQPTILTEGGGRSGSGIAESLGFLLGGGGGGFGGSGGGTPPIVGQKNTQANRSLSDSLNQRLLQQLLQRRPY